MANRYSLEEELELGRMIRHGHIEAQHLLLDANLDVIKANIRHFRYKGVDDADLYQEGWLGLLRASESYDPDRRLRFSSHAVHWVLYCMKSALYRQGHSVVLPEHIIKKHSKLGRFQAKFISEHDREPTPEEIRTALGYDKKTLAAILSCKPVLAGTSMEEDPLETSDDDLDEALHAQMTWLNDALKRLPAEEREVLARSYGLHRGGAEHLADICQHMGCSKARASALKTAALENLKGLA